MNAAFTLAFQPIFNPGGVEQKIQSDIRTLTLNLRYK